MEAAAGHALYHAATLVARATESTTTTSATASATTSGSASGHARPAAYKIVGIILAVCSGLFIGVSFVLKKIGLLKANKKYNEEAGEGYGYLKNVWWWRSECRHHHDIERYILEGTALICWKGRLFHLHCRLDHHSAQRSRTIGRGGHTADATLCDHSWVLDLRRSHPRGLRICRFLGRTAVWQKEHDGLSQYLQSYWRFECCLHTRLRFSDSGTNQRRAAVQQVVHIRIARICRLHSADRDYLSQRKYTLSEVIGSLMLTHVQKALNLFNAALVTPTYYVFFTSSTIVTSAVLFQGFHGTATQIVDVILGFLVICSGVVLLQLAKSAKDVPDTAVFSGDLDQVRTVAEQEEPEYEPRADTLRGGAGIVRAMSKIRTKRQVDELKRLHEEHMQPIGENEEVQWDGVRRRRTVSSVSGPGSISRRKTVHPPLGMSHFPDEVSEPDSEVHPGFFGRIGRKTMTSMGSQSNRRTGHSPVPLADREAMKTSDGPENPATEHVYGLPSGLQRHGDHEDTSYRGATGLPPPGHVQWASNDGTNERERASSQASSLMPPRPPPHDSNAAGNRRQFSFQNVFGSRRRTMESDDRPISRGALSFVSRHSNREYPAGRATTEEERLGLVHGDTSKANLPAYNEAEEDAAGHDSDEWQVTSGTSSSPEMLGVSGDLGKQRRRDPYDDSNDDRDLYDEPLQTPDGTGGGGGAGKHPGNRAGAFI
nr:magnesium transporter nipa3 [Quercus suber]